MVAIVNISHRIWPLSAFDRWRGVAAYHTSLGRVLDTARRYADTVSDEVAIATGRSPARGRALTALGHLLGWGGLGLSLLGIATIREADLKHLLFGPFGIGILMQLPSGALVRAGRRELWLSEEEQLAVDKRRPVVLLRAGSSDDDVDFLNDTLRPAFLRFGPLIDSSKMAPSFGEADIRAELTRQMDHAVMLVLAPSKSVAASHDLGWEIDTIARRRLAHKLMVLMPTVDGAATTGQMAAERQTIWDELQAKLTTISGFEGLPKQYPAGLIAMHLASAGELTLITGGRRPRPDEYERAVDAAIYGMKCHGRW